MDASQIVSLVGSLGFPVVVALFLIINGNKQNDTVRAELLSLTREILQTVKESTEAMTSLESYIKDRRNEYESE